MILKNEYYMSCDAFFIRGKLELSAKLDIKNCMEKNYGL